MNWRRLIPNSISSASLIFGVLSIFKTIEGDFFLAPVFIVIAVILILWMAVLPALSALAAVTSAKRWILFAICAPSALRLPS